MGAYLLTAESFHVLLGALFTLIDPLNSELGRKIQRAGKESRQTKFKVQDITLNYF